jgi:hypothetical protein
MLNYNLKTRVAPVGTMLAKVALAALLAVSASAEATVLLDVVDVPDGVAHRSLSFFATDPATTISIGAYNSGSVTYIQNISLQLGGAGHNLLLDGWVGWDGSPISAAVLPGNEVVQDLLFFGYGGAYDTFLHSISLNQGSSYQLSFDADISGIGFGGNGLRVEANVALTAPVTTPVPEPESYALMLAGLAGLGAMSRRKRAAK